MFQSKSSLSRRSFVVAAAGSAAALAFGMSGCGNTLQESPKPAPDEKELTVDAIIVGSGGTGMAAAMTLAESELKPRFVMLEKMGVLGGNTNFSESGMNASETKFQKAEGIEDTNQLFADETFKGGHEKAVRELVDHMCNNSGPAIDWLDGMGISLSRLTTGGGTSVKRMHRPADGQAVGEYLMAKYTALCKQKGIEPIKKCEVTEFVMEDGKIAGVKAKQGDKEVVYHAPVVINAMGGFGSNKEMIGKLRPDIKDAVSTNHPGATGDGMVLAEKVGAELIQMDQIQLHPTVEQKEGKLVPEAVRGEGAILVNKDGKRFIDEMQTRDVVSKAEFEQPEMKVYILFDQTNCDTNQSLKKKFVEQGYAKQGKDLAELAAALGVPTDALQATVEDYNKVVAGEKEDDLSRKQGLKPINAAPFYAIQIAPGIHHCMGGVRIDTKNQVLNKDGQPIPGLFAAGEVTGGIHGGNRLGGNAVCDITVNGRQAGQTALEYLKGIKK